MHIYLIKVLFPEFQAQLDSLVKQPKQEPTEDESPDQSIEEVI